MSRKFLGSFTVSARERAILRIVDAGCGYALAEGKHTCKVGRRMNEAGCAEVDWALFRATVEDAIDALVAELVDGRIAEAVAAEVRRHKEKQGC